MPLNTSLRTAAYLIWMNRGAEAALAKLDATWRMFITNFPTEDTALPETRRLWADVVFGLGDSERVSHQGLKVTELLEAGKTGDILGVLLACQEVLSMELTPAWRETQLLHFLWISSTFWILFEVLWVEQRYEELLVLSEQTLPFFLALPWRSGLDALWWNFKITLAARGQGVARVKLEALRENEQLLQKALGQVDLSYTLLVEVLLEPLLPLERIPKLRKLEAVFKARLQPELEQIAGWLAEQVETCLHNLVQIGQ